jgi:N-acetylglucosaminyldiphosphoundecaprenol N-acetyl-beta-D-mannosaminyltransferase
VEQKANADSRSLPECYRVLGIPVSVLTEELAEDYVNDWAKDNIGRFIAVRDVPSLTAASEDTELKNLHELASLVFPDGMPLVLIGKWRGLPVKRVCGPDFMNRMMKSSGETGLRHYLYGGKPGVVEKLVSAIKKKYPDVRIVGIETPPFREKTEDEEAATLRRIVDSGADVVWVGISSPKQDRWMYRNYKSLPQTLIGVGAAFDFLSGEVLRAPVWMQRTSLEWLFRLMSEPKRLWRRYLIVVPRFLWRVVAEKSDSRI